MLFTCRFVRQGCDGHSKLAILPQFLLIDSYFVPKGGAGSVKIAILYQYFCRLTFMSCEEIGLDTSKGPFYFSFLLLDPTSCKRVVETPNHQDWEGKFVSGSEKNTPVLDYIGTMLGVDEAYVGPVLIHVRLLEALLGPNSSHVEFILSQERVFLLSLHPTFVRPTRNPFFPHIDVWGFCF